MSEKFIYIVILTNGQEVRVETAGDPTDHPAFYGRVADVVTIGPSRRYLSLV